MQIFLESPQHTQVFSDVSVFNWTATYRRDSTIVTPYERWEYYDRSIIILLLPMRGGSIMTGVSRQGTRTGTMLLTRQDRWRGLCPTVGQGEKY